MFDCSKIKLVIWDLDETFWKGIISEEAVEPILANIELVKNLTDMGIVNAICSKNDEQTAQKELEKWEIWDYFVFNSINWDAKGNRIKQLIANMALRDENVLFIDDNPLNLEEAQFFCPALMTALPNDLDELYSYAQKAVKKDKDHKRWQQYKVMEQKREAKNEFASNEAFLKSCDIHVEMCEDCWNQIERIHELILRSNQLNYTKKRSTMEELKSLIENTDYRCGYVHVWDKFGDYGIVGFYAITQHVLEHFAFSCRTLGMAVEQYVYAQLGFPTIAIVGNVSVPLLKDFVPHWINQQESSSVSEGQQEICAKLLFKGPCDLNQIFSFIQQKDQFDTEFSYISEENGVFIEGHNHTAQIVEALELTQEEKENIIAEVPFGDQNMFETNLGTKPYDFIFLSTLTDGNLGLYRQRATGHVVAFGEYYYDLTDPANYRGYQTGEIYNANHAFTEKELIDFAERYEYIGRISAPELVSNLDKILSKLDKRTTLVLMLGVEKPCEKNHQPAFSDRHMVHREFNRAITAWASAQDNVLCISFDSYVKTQNDFMDTINHFQKNVYYDVANEIVNITREKCAIKRKNKVFLWAEKLKQLIKKVLKRA